MYNNIVEDVTAVLFGDDFLSICGKYQRLLDRFKVNFDDLDYASISELFIERPNPDYLYGLLVYALLDFQDILPPFVKNYDIVKDSNNKLTLRVIFDFDIVTLEDAKAWAKDFSQRLDMKILFVAEDTDINF